jgi:peptidoglycan/LPS O-acetylase OafA/YrhL
MHKRDVRYEFIRVISMVLVIAIHSFATISPTYADSSLAGMVLSRFLFLSNGLFFMISGKFALCVCCKTGGDYGRYLLKRFGNLGIPILVCMLLRSMFNVGGWWPEYFLSLEFLKEYIQNVLSGFTSYEYWFLYKLVGFLIVAPFVGKMLQQATKSELLWFVGLGIFWNSLNIYLPEAGFSFSWEYPLDGCFVLFVLGYAIERIVETRKEENILLILGCVGFVAGIALQCAGWGAGGNDLAPTYAVSVAAMFTALKRIYRPGGKLDTVFIKLGAMTMSVYLLHMIVLHTVVPYIPQGQFCLRGSALVLVTLCITLAVGYVFEKTILSGLKWIFWKVTRLQ